VDVESAVGKRAAPAIEADGPNAPAAAAFVHFRQGALVEDVMARMNRARSTVIQYLVDYLRHEQVMDPEPWLESDVFRKVETAVEAVGLAGLKPIFEHLRGEVPYDQIRIAAACLANRDGA
jgi:ATP-dependent DNA helicase RecQ